MGVPIWRAAWTVCLASGFAFTSYGVMRQAFAHLAQKATLDEMRLDKSRVDGGQGLSGRRPSNLA